MAKRKIDPSVGAKAIADFIDGDPESLPMAVRFALEEIAQSNPGNSVELRIPPFGATQCIEGPDHRRGTPANVVEMKPESFLDLVTGELTWQELMDAGLISASGNRVDLLAELFPLKISHL
ncbi:MAG TPA: sterol carrier family protein [Microbacteriaceae bacterium]